MKKRIASFLLAIAIAAGASAQEATHVLAKLRFEIAGMTGAEALRKAVRLSEGLEFPSAEALGAYLSQKRQEMLNLRVFKSVELSERIIGMEGDRVLHEALFAVADSFTFIPIPYAVYDSNSGLEAGAELTYDNAFGTLTNWYLNPYVRMHDRDGNYGVWAWKVNPRVSNLWIGKAALTFDLDQERVETQMKEEGAISADYSYYLSAIGLSAELDLGGDWTYTVAPRFEARYGFVDYLGNGNFSRDRFTYRLTQDLEVGKVDWIGNFRKGANAKLEHVVNLLDRDGELALVNELSLASSWYLLLLPGMNYYGRARAVYDFNAEARNLGGDLRGINDNDIAGIGGAFASQTIGIDVLRWKGVLDLQLHPFLDAGIAAPHDRAFDAKTDFKVGTGADVALFIDAVSNLVLRATFGVDLLSAGAAEAVDKMEIIVTTNLSY
jgi:hypothetical protein